MYEHLKDYNHDFFLCLQHWDFLKYSAAISCKKKSTRNSDLTHKYKIKKFKSNYYSFKNDLNASFFFNLVKME